MIQTAAIIWATLATGLGIIACMGWFVAEARAADMKAALRDIQQQRSDIVRRGNLTRAAKRKAAEAAKREEANHRLRNGL